MAAGPVLRVEQATKCSEYNVLKAVMQAYVIL